MKNSVHYELGNKNEIAIVLSCPGQKEESAIPQGPAKGQTGKNLEGILEFLTLKHKYPGFTRKEIHITNAWDKVEYPKKTSRSEASISEIMRIENLDRLSIELGIIKKFIICCGDNAIAAVLALKYAHKINTNTKIIFLGHLGNQALNLSIKNALDGTIIKSYSKAKDKPDSEQRSLKEIRNNNRSLRLEVIAKKISNQIT